MAWTIEVTRRAEKQLAALHPVIRRRVIAYLDRVVASGDPRLFGEGLVGGLSGRWRYRVAATGSSLGSKRA